MSLQGDTDNRRRRRDESEPETAGGSNRSTRPGKGRRGSGEVGEALKIAYQRTIDEEIPPEMLDLLGKLD